jgi:hypothetical protein
MPVNKETDAAENSDLLQREPNEIRDLIFTALSLTEYTKVPVLFLGSPGVAKTTGVRLWAETFGYKVTTLIGTQRVAEEILGYMVNDTTERRLITYTPDWFDEIAENKKAGFKTLLFVDELSQAPDNVQGAMLQLIFDRRVGGRDNYLPDDTVVVAAANYKGNIPPQCSIQAPTLNRFAIINVNPVDGIGLIDEFLQTEDARRANIPVFQRIEISDTISNTVRDELKSVLTQLVSTYVRQDEKTVVLDFNNTQFNEMFDRDGPIYNFISGRTISYLYRMALGMIHLGIVRKVHKKRIEAVCLGLAGLGTNSFTTDKEREDFQVSLTTGFQKVLRRSVESNMNEINALEIDFKGKTVEKCISDWMRYQESKGRINDKNIVRLLTVIESKYGADLDKMEKVIPTWDNNRVLSDLQKISSLIAFLKTAQLVDIVPIIKRLETVDTAWEAYKVAILANLVK